MHIRNGRIFVLICDKSAKNIFYRGKWKYDVRFKRSICESYRRVKKPTHEEFRQWSDPIYPCPKCGGNMRMNMYGGRVLTSLPPIQQSEYQCEQCGFTEYI